MNCNAQTAPTAKVGSLWRMPRRRQRPRAPPPLEEKPKPVTKRKAPLSLVFHAVPVNHDSRRESSRRPEAFQECDQFENKCIVTGNGPFRLAVRDWNASKRNVVMPEPSTPPPFITFQELAPLAWARIRRHEGTVALYALEEHAIDVARTCSSLRNRTISCSS